MYYIVVVVLMLVLPAGSIIGDMGRGAALTPLLVAKWYVFWAVGWRLLLAGVRQVAQPGYTARAILGLKSDDALIVVRELGFANIAIGTLGIASIAVASWQLAAALAGGIFYALAGVAHLLQPHRNRLETVAMLSDLFAAAVLLGTCILGFSGR